MHLRSQHFGGGGGGPWAFWMASLAYLSQPSGQGDTISEHNVDVP